MVIMNGGNWQRIPIVSINVISLSHRQEYAQCEVWIARLHKTGAINDQPAEYAIWNIANYEYDRLIKDIETRWPGTIISSEDHRLSEWQTYGGKLPGPPPQTASLDESLRPVVGGKAQPERIVILFLASDPTNETRLRLGEELREIQEKLRLASQRERFELCERMSVRPADVSQALLDVRPEIVHFSGHGTATGELCFEDQTGRSQPVQPDALAALFEQFANHVNCVLLNACHSEAQAKAIAAHIEYVIGMNQAIDDKAAIAFAIGFYQALGAGRTIEDAYKLGCVQIRLHDIPEHLTPVLIKK
jgi:hypothetical protein